MININTGNSKQQELTDILIENIYAQLALRDWSLKMLSVRADIPYESLKKLVNRKIGRPSFYVIWQVAQALECSLDTLAGRFCFSGTSQATQTGDIQISRILTDLEGILGITP